MPTDTIPTYHASSHDAPAWFFTRWDGRRSLARSACSWRGSWDCLHHPPASLSLMFFFYSCFDRSRTFFCGSTLMYVDRSSFSHIAHVSTAIFGILIVYVDTSKYITCPFSGPVEDDAGARSNMRRGWWSKIKRGFFHTIGIWIVNSLKFSVFIVSYWILIWIKGHFSLAFPTFIYIHGILNHFSFFFLASLSCVLIGLSVLHVQL